MDLIYSITKGKDKPLERREPTVGKWYVGVTTDLDTGQEDYSLQARYFGLGQWSNEDGKPNSGIEMSEFNYILEQQKGIDPNSNIALDTCLPEPTRSQVMVARMRALYGQINLSKQEVDLLVLATETGDERNNLTNVNIHMMIAMNILAAVANKKEKELVPS